MKKITLKRIKIGIRALFFLLCGIGINGLDRAEGVDGPWCPSQASYCMTNNIKVPEQTAELFRFTPASRSQFHRYLRTQVPAYRYYSRKT